MRKTNRLKKRATKTNNGAAIAVLPPPDNATPANATGLADEMLARTARLNQAGVEIQAICDKRGVRLVVGSLNLTNDGRLDPQIHLVAIS